MDENGWAVSEVEDGPEREGTMIGQGQGHSCGLPNLLMRCRVSGSMNISTANPEIIVDNLPGKGISSQSKFYWLFVPPPKKTKNIV